MIGGIDVATGSRFAVQSICCVIHLYCINILCKVLKLGARGGGGGGGRVVWYCFYETPRVTVSGSYVGLGWFGWGRIK